jgi:hypothetical protein
VKELLIKMVERKKSELRACKLLIDTYLDSEDYLKAHINKLHIEILKKDLKELTKIVKTSELKPKPKKEYCPF